MSLAHRTHSPALAVLACLVGVALQLQQGQLQAESVYAAVLAASLLLLAAAWRRPSLWLALLAALLLGWGSTGWRAAHFQAGALNPALEGRDIEVRGQVQGLPQPGADSLRFRLRVDEAWLDGRPVVLPALLALAWYAPRPGQADPWDDTESARQHADLRSGEVWRMVVRLKAPHGGRNPHGFDQELWLWEQGIQAVGHVRSGPRDAPPQRLQAAGWNVDGLRQSCARPSRRG